MEKVPLLMRSSGQGAATGSLGVQILPHLKFMSKFKSGGYDSGVKLGDPYDASIGELRNGTWTDGNAHNGGDDGTWAYAIQFGTNSTTCATEPGIDLIVSFNQWNDTRCNTEDTSCVGDPMRYQAPYKILATAVCATDWSKATPVPWLND